MSDGGWPSRGRRTGRFVLMGWAVVVAYLAANAVYLHIGRAVAATGRGYAGLPPDKVVLVKTAAYAAVPLLLFFSLAARHVIQRPARIRRRLAKRGDRGLISLATGTAVGATIMETCTVIGLGLLLIGHPLADLYRMLAVASIGVLLHVPRPTQWESILEEAERERPKANPPAPPSGAIGGGVRLGG